MTFWIFAYGSLMADGWETAHECKFRGQAILRGHSRSFDKKSTESRGTPEHPAPTLRVVASQDDCQGVAFEFEDDQRDAVGQYLLKREGRRFPLRERPYQFSWATSWVNPRNSRRFRALRYGLLKYGGGAKFELAVWQIAARRPGGDSH